MSEHSDEEYLDEEYEQEEGGYQDEDPEINNQEEDTYYEEENDDEEEEEENNQQVETAYEQPEETYDQNLEENNSECAQESDSLEENSNYNQQNFEDSTEQLDDMQQQFNDGAADAGPPAFNFDSIVKGALDGFGSGSMNDIVGTIEKLTGGQGGLTNMMASGGLEAMASGLVANAAHHFFGINPETGKIIGAIAGNIIFNLGGKDNSLSGIGKLVLENIISGKFKRKIDPFISPTPGMPSFNLVFNVERDRCLREKRLFEDPEFPAIDRSLYYNKAPKKSIEWKRPAQIVNDPQLIVDKQSRFDVVQGSLGDCWLLAATATLTLRDELFYRVVPPDQSFTENYAGIFHFQFWRYGHWIDVVIDDRLPTHNGELVYMHSANQSTFWSALLEKAYAKLYGSYEALKGGSTAEALEDFTGGLIEYYDLNKASKEQLLAILVRGFQMGSMFGCSIDSDPSETEARLDNGLVRGHAYSITALQTVEASHGQTVLLRIRNPWGCNEWKGAWSDNSLEWEELSYEQRQTMNSSFSEDGEFWMSFNDFIREFQCMENCNLGPEILNEINEMTGVDEANVSRIGKWTNFSADGQWLIAAGTAGGCRNNKTTFGNNPQYSTLLTFSPESVEPDGKVTVIAAVLQKYRRELRTVGLDSLSIGFVVFSLDDNYSNYRKKLDESFLNEAHSVAKSPSFINLREITVRFRVPPGSYVIVPSTYKPNEEAEFFIRVFSSGQIQACELH